MTKAKQDKEKRKGIPRTRKPFDIDAAKTMYEQGTHKIRALAAWSGYCYGTVRRRLIEAGVKLDKPGGNRRKRKDTEPAVVQDDTAASTPQAGEPG